MVISGFFSARSPVYSHIAITLHGLPMIRSLGQQHIMLEQFHTYQNQHSQVIRLYDDCYFPMIFVCIHMYRDGTCILSLFDGLG